LILRKGLKPNVNRHNYECPSCRLCFWTEWGLKSGLVRVCKTCGTMHRFTAHCEFTPRQRKQLISSLHAALGWSGYTVVRTVASLVESPCKDGNLLRILSHRAAEDCTPAIQDFTVRLTIAAQAAPLLVDVDYRRQLEASGSSAERLAAKLFPYSLSDWIGFAEWTGPISQLNEQMSLQSCHLCKIEGVLVDHWAPDWGCPRCGRSNLLNSRMHVNKK
jgi:hypothetical protein